MSRILHKMVVACVAIVVVCSCSPRYDRHDEIPMHDQWWVEPEVAAELEALRNEMVRDWQRALEEHRQQQCVETVGDSNAETDTGESEAMKPGDDAARQAAELGRVLVDTVFGHLEESGAGVEVRALRLVRHLLETAQLLHPELERTPAGMDRPEASGDVPELRQPWICDFESDDAEQQEATPTTEVRLREIVTNDIEPIFGSYPPTIRVYMLEAYHRDLLRAAELSSTRHTCQNGLQEYVEACHQETTPLEEAIEQTLKPDLRERWDWSGDDSFSGLFPDGLEPEDVEPDELVFDTCETAASLHEEHLPEIFVDNYDCEGD